MLLRSKQINPLPNEDMLLQEELVFTQQRVESKRKEGETEKHLKQLNKRESGRLMVSSNKLWYILDRKIPVLAGPLWICARLPNTGCIITRYLSRGQRWHL